MNFRISFLASPNLDHLNREELLFELEMAIQHNEYLNEQLNSKILLTPKNSSCALKTKLSNLCRQIS
jgi:hypothetical protein